MISVGRPPAAWPLLAAVCLSLLLGHADAGALPDSVVAASKAEEPETSTPGFSKEGKQALVIACNGFADRLNARVGIRPLPRRHHKARGSHHGAARHLRHHRGGDDVEFLDVEPGASESDDAAENAATGESEEVAKRRAVAAAVFKDAVWSRPLAYGECAEYHVDLREKQLFFLTPGGGDVCKLSKLDLVKMAEADAISDEPVGLSAAEMPQRLAVVLSQPQATSTRCSLQTQALTHRLSRYGAAAAELAVIDAYSQADGPEEIVIDGENATLPPLDTGAVVRLEDVVNQNIIAAENLASRTLGLGAEYAVEPKDLHVILEDLRGSEEFGHKDISFKADHTYVAIRLGRSGDSHFQPQLLFYESKDGEK